MMTSDSCVQCAVARASHTVPPSALEYERAAVTAASRGVKRYQTTRPEAKT